MLAATEAALKKSMAVVEKTMQAGGGLLHPFVGCFLGHLEASENF